MTPVQRGALTGAGCLVACLAAFGMGEAQGALSVHPAKAKPPVVVTTTVYKDKPVPGPTQTVTTVTPECKRYLAASTELLTEFTKFTAGYGGVQDQLNLSFDAIAMSDEDSLNRARIKLADMDHAAADAFSRILILNSQADKLRAACPEAKVGS